MLYCKAHMLQRFKIYERLHLYHFSSTTKDIKPILGCKRSDSGRGYIPLTSLTGHIKALLPLLQANSCLYIQTPETQHNLLRG